MTRKEFIRRFITVHKCVGCGEILEYEYSDKAFCEFCRLAWNSALNVGCTRCFMPARSCECIPNTLKKRGALVLRKLFFYEKESAACPEVKLLYQLKKQKSRRLTDFAAECLCPLVLEETEALEIPRERIVVCSVPRGLKKKYFYGFDHAALIAQSLAKKAGLEYLDVFRSSVGARTQKMLNAKSRMKNAEKNVKMRKEIFVDGKYVVLIDDIVTTGASMSACVALLIKAGASGVVCASLASKNNG